MKGKCRRMQNGNPVSVTVALCCFISLSQADHAEPLHVSLIGSVCIMLLADRWWTRPLWQGGGSGWISRSLWHTLAWQICGQRSLPAPLFQPFAASFPAGEKRAIRARYPCKRGLYSPGVGSWLRPKQRPGDSRFTGTALWGRRRRTREGLLPERSSWYSRYGSNCVSGFLLIKRSKCYICDCLAKMVMEKYFK